MTKQGRPKGINQEFIDKAERYCIPYHREIANATFLKTKPRKHYKDIAKKIGCSESYLPKVMHEAQRQAIQKMLDHTSEKKKKKGKRKNWRVCGCRSIDEYHNAIFRDIDKAYGKEKKPCGLSSVPPGPNNSK